jgi:hypothetical protein
MVLKDASVWGRNEPTSLTLADDGYYGGDDDDDD